MNESDAPILSIFADALACDSLEERAAHLDRVCRGDSVLRAQVDALLQAHYEAGDFLRGRDAPADFPSITPEAPCETTGTIIGPYKLLEQIGEGGMGAVYMADQQTPVHRRVALKIIKPGMDTRKVIARFEAERQALALMEHPHIAKVLDAGTTEGGRPYFVMELVKGIPITQYCDEHRLTPRQRLELFIPVCEAVQHAHQKGIIHRDLKPTNVLVADYDERPVAKIIDFGVVKAIGQRLTEQTMFTEFGQVVGTIEYMSPEQAKLNQLDIDTRTDVYSLGVLLYELLTGSTPFDQQRLRNAAFDEMLRIIREEEPPKPSTRLSTSGTLSAIAANRGTEQARLGKIVRGELDWIVMKALDKDRSRRYQTAGALARELQHYLDDEPVEACPPSAAYRLRKFARRNRVVLVTAGLVAAALLAGTAASVSQAIRATTAETLAEARLEAESNAHEEANDARAKAEAIARKARQAVDDMYTQVAEKWLAHQPQIEPVQREFLEKALQYYAEFAKETSTEPVVRLETAGAFRRIAEIQHRFGQTAQAEEAFERAADHLQALVDQFPSVPQYRADLAATLHKLGVLFGDTGRYDQEEKIHRRALALEERLAADFPATPSYRCDLGRGHWFVARVLTSLHRRRDAEQAYRSALTIQSPLVAEFPAVPEYRELLAESHFGLGNVLRNLGRTEEYQQALGEAAFILEQLAPDFPALPGYRNQLGNVYYWMMRGLPPSKEAEQYLRRALALQEKLVDDFPAVADYRYDLFRSQRTLGWLLSRTNRAEEAEIAFRKAAAIADQLIADSPSVHYYRGGLALMYMSLGEFLTENGRLSEAVDAYRQAIVVLERLVVEFPDVPEYGPDLRQSYCNLALLLNRAGQTQEAGDVYAKALRVDPHDSAGLNHLAWLLAIPPDSPSRDPEKAIDLAEKAIKLAPERTKYWRTLGAAHYRAGKWKEAVAALEKAKGPHARHHKFDCCFLAMAHWQLGNREEARKWYAEAAKLTENSSRHDQLQRLLAEAAALMVLDSEVSEPDLDMKPAADSPR